MYHKFFTDSVNLKAVEEKAINGSGIAQFELGIAYFVGNGIKTDLTKAIEWLTKATENGITDAYVVLGDIYFDSRLPTYDLKKAKEWHTLGIKNGSHDSLFELSMLYMNEYDINPTKKAISNLKFVLKYAKKMNEREIEYDLSSFMLSRNIE